MLIGDTKDIELNSKFVIEGPNLNGIFAVS